MTKTHAHLLRLTLSALFLALCMLLPTAFGPQLAKILSPMHIPVLLCGFICGGPYGLVVGAVAPLMRSVFFGMPQIFPDAIGMTFELAAYGLAAGLFHRLLPKKPVFTYVSLISAMLVGRVVWGLVRWAMALMFRLEFTFDIFLAGAFITAVPGIICHILLIPPIVILFERLMNPSLTKEPGLG